MYSPRSPHYDFEPVRTIRTSRPVVFTYADRNVLTCEHLGIQRHLTTHLTLSVHPPSLYLFVCICLPPSAGDAYQRPTSSQQECPYTSHTALRRTCPRRERNRKLTQSQQRHLLSDLRKQDCRNLRLAKGELSLFLPYTSQCL